MDISKPWSLWLDRHWHEETFDTIQEIWDYCKANAIAEFAVYKTAPEPRRISDAVFYREEDEKRFVCADIEALKGETLCF